LKAKNLQQPKKLDQQLVVATYLPPQKKTGLTPLGIILDHLGSPPVSGPYTAAIGTMCYQFQGDTPGETTRQSTKVRIHQGWTTKMNTRAFGISLSHQLLVVSILVEVASKRKKEWGSRIQKMLKSSYLFRGGKCWYLSPATRKICWIILPGLP